MTNGTNIKETRPKSFDEYVGQDQAKAILRDYAARAMGLPGPIAGDEAKS